MTSNFQTAMKNRRTHYTITSKSPISDEKIREIVEFAVLHSPTPFNCQSGRAVLLLNDQHKKLWDIVRETLRKLVPADKFKPTDDKISSFAAGHGTVLFYEDENVLDALRNDFKSYADMIHGFSENANGMLQFAIWTMLRDAGLGASLQHYGNLIQDEVAKTWNLDPKWRMVAQMPFGEPGAGPGEKEFQPIDTRVKIFS